MILLQHESDCIGCVVCTAINSRLVTDKFSQNQRRPLYLPITLTLKDEQYELRRVNYHLKITTISSTKDTIDVSFENFL